MPRCCLLFLLAFAQLAPVQSVDAFFKDTFEQMLRQDPQFATSIGRHEYDDRWTDWSKVGRAQRRAFFAQRPWRLESVDLNPYRSGRRFQELVFTMAAALTRDHCNQDGCVAPAHVLFPQFLKIVEHYLRNYVNPTPPAKMIDVFLSPYYGWCIENLAAAIRPETSQGEAPEISKIEANRGTGSTGDVDYWTSREPREVVRSHLNYMVPDTQKWEQSAAYYIDTHPAVDAFVKNAGLGSAIPYFHNGEPHEYIPDFIVRLKTPDKLNLILETKGYDPLRDKKVDAAQRWVNAVKTPEEVPGVLTAAASGA